MVLAVNAGEKMNRSAVTNWMLWTIVGGFIFVGSQAWEWYHFIMGDSGAVETARQEILHVYNAEGERLSFSQIVHGMEEGHASNHGETFTKAEVLSSMKGDASLYLKGTRKSRSCFYPRRKCCFLEAGDVVQGANMIHNEYGRKQFANFFFFITGFHGFHVFSGVVINFVIFYNVLLGTYERRGHYRMVEKVGLYWHFVDLVWVFVFTFFYLV
jgi:cytochrome c oxidase subunit 3